jgi:hypothetical protein
MPIPALLGPLAAPVLGGGGRRGAPLLPALLQQLPPQARGPSPPAQRRGGPLLPPLLSVIRGNPGRLPDALIYQIYGNAGSGGPVDTSVSIGTSATLSWTSPVLAYPSDWTFLVRSYDPTTGLEEQNVACLHRLVLDAAGNDITGRPNPPTGLTALLGANGTLRLRWVYLTAGQLGIPLGFRVYVGTPTPNLSAPYVTVAYFGGQPVFFASISGLSEGVGYQALVKAYNAVAEDGGGALVSVTGSVAGPSAPDAVSAAAVP